MFLPLLQPTRVEGRATPSPPAAETMGCWGRGRTYQSQLYPEGPCVSVQLASCISMHIVLAMHSSCVAKSM